MTNEKTYTITRKGSTPWASGVPRSEARAELGRACRVAGEHWLFDDETGEEVQPYDLLPDDD